MFLCRSAGPRVGRVLVAYLAFCELEQGALVNSISSIPKAFARVPGWKGFRDIPGMIVNPIEVLAGYAQSEGPSFYYRFGGVRQTLVTTDPAVVRHMLKSNHRNYHKSDIQTQIMTEFLGEGLLTDRWEEWRVKRQGLASAFHPHKLDGLAPTVEGAMDIALQGLEARAESGPVSFKEEVTLITFAMAARSFFGLSFSLDDVGELSGLIGSIQTFMTKLVVVPFLRPWWQLTGELGRQQSDRRRGDALLMARIRERIDGTGGGTSGGTGGGTGDLLDILLDMTVPGPEAKFQLTLSQVLAESMQMLVAGHETSSNAFTWLMLLLDANPEARQIVAGEFGRVLSGRAPIFSDIARLPKTDAIIEEALRLFPPFWMIDRVALEDDDIGGQPIQAGTTIVAFLYGIHRAPALWSDPGAFRADRFDESRQQVRDFHHLPFGAGPRRCIGANYAKLQIFALLHRFISRYEVTFVQGNTPGLDPKFILGPAGSVPATITRKKAEL